MNDITLETADNEPDQHQAQSPYLLMVQSVSHELRSVFGIISGMHSLLPLASGEDERKDMFHRLQNNTEYAAQLFTALEEYCAMEAGPVQVENSSFRPAGALEYIRKKAQPMLERRRASLTLDGDREMRVDGDEEKVQCIVRNLVFHLASVARVRDIAVTWGQSAHSWHVDVNYLGEPLPAWLFYAGDQSYDESIGSHVGLLIVRRLVSVLGGKIREMPVGTPGRRGIALQFPI